MQKNLFAGISLLGILLFTSCTKEELPEMRTSLQEFSEDTEGEGPNDPPDEPPPA